MSFLKIELNITSDFHKDIRLVIPDLQIAVDVDSYHLLKDTDVSFNGNGYDKVIEVLIIVIQNWVIVVRRMKTNEIDFLPFDFSDEYIGCLRIEKQSNMLLVQYGFTQSIMGVDLFPTQYQNFNIKDKDFENDSSIVSIDEEAFLNCLDSNIRSLLNTA